MEGHFPVEGLRVKDLEQLCREVGDVADHLGQLLAAVHGGSVTFLEPADVPSEGESCVDAAERWRPVVLPPAPPAGSGAVRRVLQRNGRRDTAGAGAAPGAARARAALPRRRHARGHVATASLRRRAAGERCIAINVHGCFWHRCPEHFHAPANAEWWRAKSESVVARDADTERQLTAAGWLPVAVWEHEGMTQAARRIAVLDAGHRQPKARPAAPP